MQRVGIRVPCPAAVNAAHQHPQTSGRLEQPQIGPAHMSAQRRHAALWKMLHANGINDPPAGPAECCPGWYHPGGLHGPTRLRVGFVCTLVVLPEA